MGGKGKGTEGGRGLGRSHSINSLALSHALILKRTHTVRQTLTSSCFYWWHREAGLQACLGSWLHTVGIYAYPLAATHTHIGSVNPILTSQQVEIHSVIQWCLRYLRGQLARNCEAPQCIPGVQNPRKIILLNLGWTQKPRWLHPYLLGRVYLAICFLLVKKVWQIKA